MDYLQRNALVFEELKAAKLARSMALPTGVKTKFTPLGSYFSEISEGEVFVGLKEYRKDSTTYSEYRVVHDLAFMRAVEKNFPGLVSELPFFYGLLRGRNGVAIGLLMEDFSKNATFDVRDMYDNFQNLPFELSKLVDPVGHKEELAKVGFEVNGHRRLGDFNTITLGLGPEIMAERFPHEDLERVLERYTLQLSYHLK